MKYLVALAALTAAVSAQNPPGCQSDFDGTFVIKPVLVNPEEAPVGNEPAKMFKRQQTVRTICGSTPIVTLEGGILRDQNGSTGSIVANTQLQFDQPLQDNALFTSGFSVCENNTLAYPGSAIFYQCLSGNPNDPNNRDALFNNLYTTPVGPTGGEADQCDQIYISVIGCEPSPEQYASFPALTATGGSQASTSASSPQATPATSTEAAEEPATTAAPYPTANNGTAPVASASGSGSPPASTSTGGSEPVPFVPGSGAASLVIGGKIVALIAGIGAFAMF
ncbi:MAG: hypothetical protein Q9221_008167 [Calogaya cf. arnoldii]